MESADIKLTQDEVNLLMRCLPICRCRRCLEVQKYRRNKEVSNENKEKITIGVIVAFLAVVMVGYIYLFTGVKISKGE